MSPPAAGLGISVQESLEIDNITDLDDADTSQTNNVTAEVKAVEHEYPCQVKENDCKNAFSETVKVVKGPLEDYVELEEDLQLVDLSRAVQHHCVVACLGESDGIHFNNEKALEQDNCTDDGDTSGIKNSTLILTRKRKKNKKRLRLSSKKVKTDLHLCEPSKNTLTKAVGGTTTKQSCNNNNSNGQCTTSAVSGLVRPAVKQSNGGIGGAGGGGDGDDPWKGEKFSAHNSSFPGENVKKRLNKKDKSGDKMEVDGSLSSKMDVDNSPKDSPMNTLSSENQINVGKVNSHVKNERSETERPDEMPPETKQDQRMKQYRMYWQNWHSRINHFSVCRQPANCHRCHEVKKMIEHLLKETKCSQDCNDCNVVQGILNYHQPKCKLHSCKVCNRPSVKNNNQEQQVQNIVSKRQERYQQNRYVEQTLNVPTTGMSLDPNEEVIYKDAGFTDTLTHFKEHQHYTFKQEGFVGKGGNGTVHDIVVHPHIKDIHTILAEQPVVIKKTKILGEDELAAYKDISTHPNFVRTFLVVTNRIDGKDEYYIVMEKCDRSLKDYLEEVAKKGLVLSKYEAMHLWIQVLDAIVYLHNRRIPIIHKDIKGGNVLLTETTNFIRAKLADFDTVKLLHNEYTRPGLALRGTKGFAAPEVMRCDVHGRPADVYSLGKLLVELLCKSLLKKPKLAIEKLKDVDAGLGHMVEQCLQENPEDRPTAIQLRESDLVKSFSCINELNEANIGI